MSNKKQKHTEVETNVMNDEFITDDQSLDTTLNGEQPNDVDTLVQIELNKLAALDAREQAAVAHEMAKIERTIERENKKALKEAKRNEPKVPKERVAIINHFTMSADKITQAWELVNVHADKDEIYAIHAMHTEGDNHMSKTDKVRRLLELGLPNFAIVVVAQVWPAYIFNVIKFDKEKTIRNNAKETARKIYELQKQSKQN